MQIVTDPKCIHCNYFKGTVLEEGECRRYSPKSIPEHSMGKFPTVLKDWWCGEWFNDEWYEAEIKRRSKK
jgi:hypothetical protein